MARTPSNSNHHELHLRRQTVLALRACQWKSRHYHRCVLLANLRKHTQEKIIGAAKGIGKEAALRFAQYG